MKKLKKNRIWYRKPQSEIIDTFFFSDGDQIVNILVSTKGDSPWRKCDNEKVWQLVTAAKNLGFKFLGDRRDYNEIEGIKTKAVQEEEYVKEEFRKAIFHSCGKHLYV